MMASDKAAAIGRLWFPLFYVLMFSSLYVWAFHQPTPHQVPVAIVASTPQAAQLAANLQAHAGDAFDMRLVADDARAKAAVWHWRVRGAWDPATGRLYVATMAAPSGTLVTEKFFRQVTAGRPGTLQVVDLAPPPRGDPRGISIFYMVIAWTIGGFLAGVVLNIEPDKPGPAVKLVILAGFAVLASTLASILAGPVLGALPTSPTGTPALIGLGALMIMIPATLSVATRNFLGMLPTNGVVATFAIFLDFPATGDAVSHYLLPGSFRALNDFMPGAMASHVGRAILYFGGANWAPELFWMFAWLAAFLVFFAVGAWWHRQQRGRR